MEESRQAKADMECSLYNAERRKKPVSCTPKVHAIYTQLVSKMRNVIHANVRSAHFFLLSSILSLQTDLLMSRLRSLRPTKKKQQQQHAYQTRSAQVRRPRNRSRNPSNRHNSDSQIDSDSDREVRAVSLHFTSRYNACSACVAYKEFQKQTPAKV